MNRGTADEGWRLGGPFSAGIEYLICNLFGGLADLLLPKMLNQDSPRKQIGVEFIVVCSGSVSSLVIEDDSQTGSRAVKGKNPAFDANAGLETDALGTMIEQGLEDLFRARWTTTRRASGMRLVISMFESWHVFLHS